jgi:hypothetical protein
MLGATGRFFFFLIHIIYVLSVDELQIKCHPLGLRSAPAGVGWALLRRSLFALRAALCKITVAEMAIFQFARAQKTCLPAERFLCRKYLVGVCKKVDYIGQFYVTNSLYIDVNLTSINSIND